MKYLVKGGVAHIGADMVLQLTKEQIDARAHRLEKVGNGHRPTNPVEFKEGETIGIDCRPDELPRNLATVLVPAGNANKPAPEPVAAAQRKKTPVNAKKVAKPAAQPAS